MFSSATNDNWQEGANTFSCNLPQGRGFLLVDNFNSDKPSVTYYEAQGGEAQIITVEKKVKYKSGAWKIVFTSPWESYEQLEYYPIDIILDGHHIDGGTLRLASKVKGTNLILNFSSVQLSQEITLEQLQLYYQVLNSSNEDEDYNLLKKYFLVYLTWLYNEKNFSSHETFKTEEMSEKLKNNSLRSKIILAANKYTREVDLDFSFFDKLLCEMNKAHGVKNKIRDVARDKKAITNPLSGDAQKVEAFIKIYQALHQGQSSFFKTNFLSKLNKLAGAQDPSQRMVCIQSAILQHVNEKPESRSALAWKLAQDHYQTCNSSNLDLFKAIYTYSFTHSNSRHRKSYLTGGLFRHPDNDFNIAIQGLSSERLEAFIAQPEKIKSRSARICSALNTRQAQTLLKKC